MLPFPGLGSNLGTNPAERTLAAIDIDAALAIVGSEMYSLLLEDGISSHDDGRISIERRRPWKMQ